MVVRSLSGAVYVALLVIALLFHTMWFTAVCMLFNIIALIEFQKFNAKRDGSEYLTIGIGTAVLIITHLVFVGQINQKWILLFMLFPLVFASIKLFQPKIASISEIAFPLLSLVYITLPLVLVNKLNLDIRADKIPFILAVLIIIWCNDSFAYLSGMAFGRHKLFERITPKKTWEGFAGGLVAALVAGWFLYNHYYQVSKLQWLILVVLIIIASVFGDFVESQFKRSVGLKDSGNIMPGHGGILDRIDSLLFVFPVVYVYILVIG